MRPSATRRTLCSPSAFFLIEKSLRSFKRRLRSSALLPSNDREKTFDTLLVANLLLVNARFVLLSFFGGESEYGALSSLLARM
jgi:hypothetical protein